MIKIAITDDHPLLLAGLKNILSSSEDIDVVGCYATAAEMRLALKTQAVDILLLDINLPDANGLDLLSELKALQPEMHILIISVHNEYAVINSVLSQGAKGYIQKNASVDEIKEGIYTLLKGQKYVCSQTRLVIEKKNSDELNRVPELTRREREILVEAAQGLTTPQIAEKLFISTHTVESHRKNLIEKFQSKNLSSVIKLAIQYGLIGQQI